MSAKLRVLKEFRPYLAFFQVYNNDKYQNCERSQVLKSIFRLLYVTISYGFLIMLFILGVWYVIDVRFNMNDISTVSLLLSTFILIITFIIFVRKNRMINTTVDRLQHIVDQRKCRFYWYLEIK